MSTRQASYELRTSSSAFNVYVQGRLSLKNSAGAKGGTIFWCKFLLHFRVIWENDPFSKSEKVPGLIAQAAQHVRRPC